MEIGEVNEKLNSFPEQYERWRCEICRKLKCNGEILKVHEIMLGKDTVSYVCLICEKGKRG